jgi:energy-coupling factor transport system permease protein
MARPIEFFSNVEKDTWVHRLDPRVKLASVLVFALIPLLYTDPLFLTGWAVLFVVIWISAKIDPRPILPLFYGALVMWVVYIIYGTFYRYGSLDPGLVKWEVELGPLVATDVGFKNGFVLGYRFFIPLLPVAITIATTEPTGMAKGFMRLGVPIPMAFILLGTLRFLPLVFEAATKVTEAQKMRGLRYKTFIQRIKNLQYLLLPLFINTLRQSRTLALAVESKGFGARRWKEFYREFEMTTTDWIVLFSLIPIAGLALYIRFGLNLGWLPTFREM